MNLSNLQWANTNTYTIYNLTNHHGWAMAHQDIHIATPLKAMVRATTPDLWRQGHTVPQLLVLRATTTSPHGSRISFFFFFFFFCDLVCYVWVRGCPMAPETWVRVFCAEWYIDSGKKCWCDTTFPMARTVPYALKMVEQLFSNHCEINNNFTRRPCNCKTSRYLMSEEFLPTNHLHYVFAWFLCHSWTCILTYKRYDVFKYLRTTDYLFSPV